MLGTVHDYLHAPTGELYERPEPISWQELAVAVGQIGVCRPGYSNQGTAGQLLAAIAGNRLHADKSGR